MEPRPFEKCIDLRWGWNPGPLKKCIDLSWGWNPGPLELCFDALYPLSYRDSTAPPTHSTSLSSILEAINIIKIFKSIAPPTHIVRVYLWFASDMLSESDAFLQRSVK